jgi:hypothetical protein
MTDRMMNDKLRKKTLFILKKTLIHASVWILLFLLNYLIVRNYPVAFLTWFHIKTWLIYILLFYINFLFLMPYFLFRKKIFVYIVLTLALLFIFNTIRFQFIQPPPKEDSMPPARDDNRPPPRDDNKPPLRADNRPPENFTFRVQPDNFRSDGPAPKKSFRWLLFPLVDGPLIPFYGMLMIYAASTTIGLIIKWQDSEKLRAETEKEKLYAELSYLKQQVNPHFLFNALNNIYSLSLSKSDLTTNAVLKLSSILRYMLYETNKKQVPLKDELDIISNYLDLQKLRLTEKVKVDYRITGNTRHYLIEPLLLLPLIENAFKYGADNMHPSFINIHIRIARDNLSLDVSNTIVQRPAKNDNDNGIGIRNTQRRLELMYAGKHTFTMSEQDDIFDVHLSIKLKK